MRALLAEGLGTFVVVFAGCGAIVVDATTGALGHIGVAAAFGLAIMVMVGAVGHISGAHLNPAVTAAFALDGHLPWSRVGGYWAAQVMGAIGAAWLLLLLFGDVATLGATRPAGSDMQSLVLEAVMTAMLMFVVVAVTTDPRAVGGAASIAIGATVGLGALFGGPISGASMNPARSIGPALVAGDLGSLWIYIVGPTVGAFVGAMTYRVVGRSPRSELGLVGTGARPDRRRLASDEGVASAPSAAIPERRSGGRASHGGRMSRSRRWCASVMAIVPIGRR